MSCKYLDMFWNKINEMLKKIKFKNNIRLQHLMPIRLTNNLGEHILCQKFCTQILFTIYKSYYVSEQEWISEKSEGK